MRSLFFYILLILFTVSSFVLFMVAFPLTLPFDRDRRVIHYMSKSWSWGMFRLCPWWRIEVSGKEHIEPGRPYVIVVNHCSMVDIPLMTSVLPLRIKWVSKREVYRWPFFGWVLWMRGDIAIARGTAGSVRRMLREGTSHLKRGTCVIVFPEGTRSRTGEPGRFREGAFLLAKEAGVDILPCVVRGTADPTDGWRLRLPHRFSVRILPPITTDKLSAAELAEKARKTIILNSQSSILNS